jgi:transposase
MKKATLELETKDLDHCGIVAGIVDELGLVEEIDRIVGIHPQQVVSTGQVVKAMILNGLGFVAAPLYLFEEFFIGKAAEHLIGEGVRPEHFNDDRLGRALDQLWAGGLTQIFMNVAMRAYRQQGIQQWQLETVFVADSALYSEDNLKLMGNLQWITRVPATLKQAKQLLQEVHSSQFQPTELEGYRIAHYHSHYAGIEQRWLIVESAQGKQRDIKQLHKQLDKQYATACSQLRQLSEQHFSCEADALKASQRLSQQLKYHCLESIELVRQVRYGQPGRPRKGTVPECITFQVQATLAADSQAIELAQTQAGRFIVATNVLGCQHLSNQQVLLEYKGQQAPERGFRFLKDPLFFTSSVFLKTPQRVAALAMVMGLCLLIYTLGQRALRQALAQAKQGLRSQLGKSTRQPTLRWIFLFFF